MFLAGGFARLDLASMPHQPLRHDAVIGLVGCCFGHVENDFRLEKV